MNYHDTVSYNFSIKSVSYVGIIRIRFTGIISAAANTGAPHQVICFAVCKGNKYIRYSKIFVDIYF